MSQATGQGSDIPIMTDQFDSIVQLNVLDDLELALSETTLRKGDFDGNGAVAWGIDTVYPDYNSLDQELSQIGTGIDGDRKTRVLEIGVTYIPNNWDNVPSD